MRDQVAEEADELLNRISGERAKGFAGKISKIQMRVPGSENERKAAELIADEFEAIGLEVSIEDFRAISWDHGPAKLSISNGTSCEFEVQLMPYSPSVSEGGSKGAIKCLRFGFPQEYAWAEGDPQIVIIDWNDNLGSLAQILVAAKSGKRIAALGVVSALDKAYRVDAVPMLQKPVPFPVFSINRSDGERLRDIYERGDATGTLSGRSEIVPDAKSANVVGRKKGLAEPGMKVLVSAHHDSWFDGANDNLSSVACVIEVARALIDVDTRQSMEFISFGCEEGGTTGYQYYLWGSRQYLERHGKKSDDLAILVNSEFAGACNSNYLLVDCTPDLLSFYDSIFDEFADKCLLSSEDVQLGLIIPPNSQADQLPFVNRGISSSIIYWSWFDEYHTDLDTENILDPEKLRLFSQLMLLSSLGATHNEILPLSLTRYARVLRVGHSDISSYLSEDMRKVAIPGFDQLTRISGDALDFSQAFAALNSFTRAASSFEKAISSSTDRDAGAINGVLVSACRILNRALCRAGGIFGEDPYFPGHLAYAEELTKIDRALEGIRQVSGADISPELKSEFHPMFKPEIFANSFDLNDEYESITSKKEKMRVQLQGEVDRIESALREAQVLLER